MVFLHIVEKVNINLHISKLWFAWKKHPNNEISVQKIVTYYVKKICEKRKTSSYICRYILFVCSIIFYFRKQKVTQFLKQEHEQWAQIRYRFFFRENNTSSDIQNEYTNRVLYFCQKKGYFSYIILCFFIINIPFIFKIIHHHFRI